jgi:NTE family protein
VGLALGGGSARGWCHIGVLRALNEIGLKPDIIAGTSMGAVVGGCYGAGALDDLEAFARRLPRGKVFGLLDIDFAGSGLFTGNKQGKLLAQRLEDRKLEDLTPTMVCVATELSTGHEVWIRRGPLVAAIRASYALPGIFQPVRFNGRWLMDGAIVNPVPVSVCRALGAQVVIAVNPASELFGHGTVVVHDDSGAALAESAIEQVEGGRPTATETGRMLRLQLIGNDGGPPGIAKVMVEAFNIIQDRIARSRLAGDPPDVTISPRLGDIGLFDFHHASQAIDLGYEAARRACAEIRDVVAVLS